MTTSSFEYSSIDMLTTPAGNAELRKRHNAVLQSGDGEFFFHASTKLEPKSYAEGEAQPTCRLFIYMANAMRYTEQATGKDLNLVFKHSMHAIASVTLV